MWKLIPNFENYLCSIKGEFSRNGKLLKQSKHEKGYLNIRLYKNGKQFSFRSHRVVYETFIGTIKKGLEINHINGIKNDNNLFNLEACTHSENLIHAIKNGLQIPKKGVMNKNSIPIYGVSIKTKEKIHFSSQAEAKRNGFNQGNIQAVLSKKRKQHGGYEWFYA